MGESRTALFCEDKLIQGQSWKSLGNLMCQWAQFAKASTLYERIVSVYFYFVETGERRPLHRDWKPGDKRVLDLLSATLSNLSLCFLKLSKFDDAMYAAERALEFSEELFTLTNCASQKKGVEKNETYCSRNISSASFPT